MYWFNKAIQKPLTMVMVQNKAKNTVNKFATNSRSSIQNIIIPGSRSRKTSTLLSLIKKTMQWWLCFYW